MENEREGDEHSRFKRRENGHEQRKRLRK